MNKYWKTVAVGRNRRTFFLSYAFCLLLTVPPQTFAQSNASDTIVLAIHIFDQDSLPIYNSSLGINKRVKVRIPDSPSYFKLGIKNRKPLEITAFKEGFKSFKIKVKIESDTVSITVILEKVPMILREVEITASRIRQPLNDKDFFALDYGLSEHGLLLFGKEESTKRIKYFNADLKLKDIRILPETALEFHQDCRKQFYILVRDRLYKLDLTDKLEVALDFNENDFFKYKSNKCLFYVDSNYFFSYVNYLGSRAIFYYSCFSCDSSSVLFEHKNFYKERGLLESRRETYKLEDPALTKEANETVTVEDLRGGITFIGERDEFYRKILQRPQKWEFHHANDKYWMLDVDGYIGYSSNAELSVSDTFSIELLKFYYNGWANKLFADEEYSRLFTTYVQGDTRIVEVKGEQLQDLRTVAIIPFNGYFPEKIKVHGPYLYYLLFDGKKRVLYRQKLEGY